jgi:SAM-dependent methyltransferase
VNENPVATAYDAIAADYDCALAGDAWMRRRLWKHFDRVFRPGQRVLDVGCGTGTDALYLAERGIDVTAIDVSPGMIARLAAKVQDRRDTDQNSEAPAGSGKCRGEAVSRLYGRSRNVGALPATVGRIDARAMAIAELATWPAEPYDGAISSFAGLSTEPDLVSTAIAVSRVLRPGGRFIAHMLNRCSLWEWLGYAQRQDWASAGELRHVVARTFVVGNRPIVHYPYSPLEAYRQIFARWFVLRQTYGLGILRPPHTVRRVTGSIAAVLGSLEQPLGSLAPFRDLGRFFVLDLERR